MSLDQNTSENGFVISYFFWRGLCSDITVFILSGNNKT